MKVALGPGGIEVQVEDPYPGVTNRLERTFDLVQGPWRTVATYWPDAETFVHAETAEGGFKRAFYRNRTCYDDFYEPNDGLVSAYTGLVEQTWLSTVNGAASAQDEDWYAIIVDAGQEQVVVRAKSDQPGADLRVELYDGGSNRLAVLTGAGADTWLSLVAPTSGTYYVRVVGGGDCADYDLWWEDGSTFYGAGSLDLVFTGGVFEVGLEAPIWGVTNRVEWTDDLAEGYWIPATNFWPAAGELLFAAPPVPAAARVFYRNRACLDDAHEPNDQRAEASAAPPAGTWLSSQGGQGVMLDEDWYRIDATNGEALILVEARFPHIAGNIDLELYDAAGVKLAEAAGTSDDEHLLVALPGGGDYYLRVYRADGPDCGLYDLRWSEGSATTRAGNLGISVLPDLAQLTLTDPVWGVTNIIERSLDLESGPWSAVTNLLPAAYSTTLEDVLDPGWPAAFYRSRTAPAP